MQLIVDTDRKLGVKYNHDFKKDKLLNIKML